MPRAALFHRAMAEAIEVGVNPAAPHPPVGFRIHVPSSWTLVDLDPRTSNRSIDGFLDQCVQAAPAAAPHRNQTRRALRQVVRQNQAQGVFVLAFLAATLGNPDHPVGASLTLAWRKLAGDRPPPPPRLAQGVAQSLATARYEEGERP